MAKRQSALASVYHRGISGQPGEPGVRLQEIADLNLVQIAAWPDMLESASQGVAQAIGADRAPGPGYAVSTERGTALRARAELRARPTRQFELPWHWHAHERRRPCRQAIYNDVRRAAARAAHSLRTCHDAVVRFEDHGVRRIE